MHTLALSEGSIVTIVVVSVGYVIACLAAWINLQVRVKAMEVQLADFRSKIIDVVKSNERTTRKLDEVVTNLANLLGRLGRDRIPFDADAP
jgi:hypothetical protein